MMKKYDDSLFMIWGSSLVGHTGTPISHLVTQFPNENKLFSWFYDFSSLFRKPSNNNNKILQQHFMYLNLFSSFWQLRFLLFLFIKHIFLYLFVSLSKHFHDVNVGERKGKKILSHLKWLPIYCEIAMIRDFSSFPLRSVLELFLNLYFFYDFTSSEQNIMKQFSLSWKIFLFFH